MRPRLFTTATLLLGLLAAHAWLYGPWIVDDAGITFSYARSAAAGHGWVSSSGEPAVEGFTNLLWAWLLLPFLRLGLFDPVWTPKLLGLACTFAAVLLLLGAARRSHPAQARWSFAGVSLLAATPALVIWSASGLENGLLALLTAALLSSSVRVTVNASHAAAAAAGSLAALAAAARPDALVLAALWPLTALACAPRPLRQRVALAATASGVTLLGVAIVTSWRWQTFGDIVPNTFHAKVGDSWPRLAYAACLGATLALTQALRWRAGARAPVAAGLAHAGVVFAALMSFGGQGIARSIGGEAGTLLVAATFGLAGRRPAASTAPWAIGTALALVQYVGLPPDWMPHHRFGTPFVVLAVPWVAAELGAARAALTGRRRRLFEVALLLVVGLVIARNARTALRFARAPTVPFSAVYERHLVIADWARQLQQPTPSAMVPDVGGALWLDELRIIDLAGLCDREIARALAEPRRLAALILDQRKPTFVEFHGLAATRSGLLDAPRFRVDYAAIAEGHDEAASRELGRPVTTGIYVRRELAPSDDVLAHWRAQWR